MSLTLKAVHLDDLTVSTRSLGTSGSCKARLSTFGDLAARSLRIRVGSGASMGSDPFCLIGSDMPSGYVPEDAPSDMGSGPVGSSVWAGAGKVFYISLVIQNTFPIFTSDEQAAESPEADDDVAA